MSVFGAVADTGRCILPIIPNRTCSPPADKSRHVGIPPDYPLLLRYYAMRSPGKRGSDAIRSKNRREIITLLGGAAVAARGQQPKVLVIAGLLSGSPSGYQKIL
jgi:hypothetical protein